MIQYLRQLGDARAGIPARIVTQFSEIIDKSEQQLNRMNPDQLVPDPTTGTIIQFLRDFEGEYRAGGELLRGLGLRLEQEWTEFSKILDLSPDAVSANPPLLELKKTLDAFADRLRKALPDPENAMNGMQKELDRLQESWRAAILQQLETVPKNKPDINNSLQQQDFIGAAQQIADAKMAAQRNVALTELEPEQQRVPSWPEVAGLLPASPLSIISSPSLIVGIPSALSGLHFQSEREVQRAKGLQTIIVGILVVVWAFTSYTKTYGGTWSDISMIFFAAFAIDVTLDAMLSKISPKSA